MTAIAVNDVCFGYKTQSILSQIYANIPESKIYGLLGPSGAGKTTLLRLILGRIKPHSGSITVLGSEPGINNPITGYMPQDTALCLSFTVNQTLIYFSNIYRMSQKKFHERKGLLSSILQLPGDNQLISELSGGQQKRVSLALAFLNSPRLVILDEPTVGTDPILGNSIWNYLHSCCREGVSVVIVTHYIEEAALAHMVGIMRNGKLMEEGVPNDLLLKYRETNLENNLNSGEDIDTSLFLNVWILLILIRKNFSKFLQFNVSFLIFLIPAFQALILCVLYDRDSIPIKAAIFNEEPNPQYSTRLLNSIKQVDAYYVQPVKYTSLSSAIDAVDKGYMTAAVWFHQNYTNALDARVEGAQDSDIDNKTLSESSIHLWLDNSNFLYANGLIDSLRLSMYELMGDIFMDKNMSRVEAPLKVVETIYAENSKLSDFLLPGYLISFMYLSQVSLSSQLLIQERKDGLFERSLVAGVGHQLVFISHFITNCLMSFIQIILMLFISFIVFQITNYGSIELILFLVMTQAANAIAIGLLISAIVDEGFVAVLISIFITFSQLFTSGAIFPFELVEPNLRQILYYSPIAMPTESLRNVMLRGWNLYHQYVFHGFALNVGTGCLFLVLAMIIFRRNS
ncbi:methionine import ATP-binding protein MetN-like [Oppia nitens]|uniref:methionine import ATP-binding protein MetN-like n=1 Tax=Oppia nitens TaxID=1686743 RepID=UPI0023DA406F|nr:methionine import ATP-binding protein MetN-like [Oppia nitens]